MDDIYIDGVCSGRQQSPGVEHAVIFAWNEILTTLLARKGLYQNITLDPSIFRKFVDEHYSAQQLTDEFSGRPIYPCSRGEGDDKKSRGFAGSTGGAALGSPNNEMPLSFYLPNIHLECTTCKLDSSFLSMSCSTDRFQSPYPLVGPATEQVFHLYYRCATCRKRYLVFQVLRRGLKAQLTGRSQPYRPRIDKVWPDSIVDLIRDALCADAENDVSAAYYHLRTAIEFHIKHELNIPVIQKIEGSELCGKYNESQDMRLRTDFPSLASLYTDLSAGLHSRKVDTALFSEMLGKLADHLRAKELFGKYTS